MANPLDLANALAFILIARSDDTDELLDYVERQQQGLRVQDALGNYGPFDE